MSMKIYFTCIFAAAILPQCVTAETGSTSSVELTYGIGVVGISGVYIGQEDALLPFPHLAASYGKWTFSIAKGIQFRALETATTNLSVAVVYDPAPETPNTALFAGLNRADGAALEIEASHDFGVFDIAAVVRRDVSQNHDGIGGEVSLGRSVMMGKALIEGRVGGSYLDSNYSNFLYGVAASEGNARRGGYDLNANWSPFVEVSAIVPMNDMTSIVAGFRHEILSKDISNSPLVATGERTTIGLTLIRQF